MSKVGVAYANVDQTKDVVYVIADLDALLTLLTALYVLADEILPRRPRARRRPKITDAELVWLAVAQILLDCPCERRLLRFAMRRPGRLSPYLPKRPGQNKRMRALAPQIVRMLNVVAFSSPSWCDNIGLLDSAPVLRRQSRETANRSDFVGHAAYGYCASRSRYFWGSRLFDGDTVIADKGFAGEDFEALMLEFGAILLRPDRKGEPPRFGRLGGIRQWVESIINSLTGQLSLERHGAITMPGLLTHVAQHLPRPRSLHLAQWQP